MATERQTPDELLQQNNLSGALADIDEDPDSPDANWLTYITNNVDTVCRISFPTPTGSPTVGADLQEFKIWVRQQPDGAGADPTVSISLYENGGLVAEVMADAAVSSTTGVLYSGTWNANLLGTPDGSVVECYIYGSAIGGAPGNRCTVEVGAVEWNVTYDTGVTEWLAGVSDGVASVAGDTKISKKIDGLTVGVASVSGDTSILKKIVGTCAGVASVSGATKIAKKVAGAIDGVALVAGDLTVGAFEALAGVINGIASVGGAIKVSKKFVGSITGIATVSGATKISKKIVGITAGVCQVTGVTKVIRKLIGVVSGIASVIADLTISGVPSVYEATILDLTEPEESIIETLNIVTATTSDVLDLSEPEETTVEVLEL